MAGTPESTLPFVDCEGGCHIIRPAPRRYRVGDHAGFTLISDLHIGARDMDLKKLKKELERARRNNDRVLINGDVFDMILPKDHRRFDPSVLHPRIVGRNDVINAAVEFGAEILSPYADLIDMIGCGNHETAVIHFHSVDPIALLIERLTEQLPENSDHQINYGGYMGYVDYRFYRSLEGGRRGGVKRLVIFYYHGSGSDCPVTKGMIDLARKQWVDADVIWMGHKHTRFNSGFVRMSCPLSGDSPTLTDVRQIFTGSYFSTYHGQSQKSIRAKGRLSSYAADAGMAPQPKGGARLIVSLNAAGFDLEVLQ